MEIDAALRKFSRQCAQAGIFRELKQRQTFTPRGQRRRRKSHRARRRAARAVARQHGG
jgi:ribosomal protein S21